jgi:hypothetical protein
MNRLRNAILVILSVFLLYGCAAVWLGVGAGVGIGTYKWIEGRLEREYPLPYLRAWDAANDALSNLQISVTNSIDEGVKGKINAVRRDGKKVNIWFKDRGQGVTTIGVRVGYFGDRDQAERVHDEIASVSGIQ